MQAETLRLFIAIELSDALRAELKHAQKQLQDECSRTLVAQNLVRWAAPQNIHLTLQFLGNSKRAAIPLLGNALETISKNYAPFELTARGLGCFPNARRPNTIWCGLAGETEPAALLAQQIEDATFALGFPRDERGFTPHLTIGRVKREASNSERAAIGELVKQVPTTTLGTIRANAIYLIASELHPQGPRYTILSEHLIKESAK